MKIIIYGKPGCTNCMKAKNLCESYGAIYNYINLGADITKKELEEKVGRNVSSVPQIFIMSGGFAEYIGGYAELSERLQNDLINFE